MQPLALAIFEIMTALLVRQKSAAAPPPRKTTQTTQVTQSPFVSMKTSSQTPQGYSKYNFQCWLCSGQTTFSCPKPTKELFFDVECSRCGMANKVKVAPPLNK